MAKVNVSVPDELVARVRVELPGLNLSQVLREGIASKLSCEHHRMRCDCCEAVFDRREVVGDELGRFYGDVQWELGELVRKVGTAEGAARVVKSVAQHWGLDAGWTVPLPRPTRANREAALAAKLTELPAPARAKLARRRIA